MRAVVYDRYGPPEGLRVAEVPTPSPATDQVLITGAEPRASNSVRPCPHHPLPGIRCKVCGVVACGGCGGCPVAVASRHGRSGPVGTALPASSWVFDSGLAPVAAGLPMALLASMPVGSGPPRGRFAWGMGWCCRTPCRWRGGGGSSGPCWPSSWPAVGGCRPFPAAVLPGRGLLVPLYSVATYGSQCLSVAGLAVAGRHAGRLSVPFRWRSGRWAGQAVPQTRSSMVRDGRGGNRWRATRAPGQHGARLAE